MLARPALGEGCHGKGPAPGAARASFGRVARARLRALAGAAMGALLLACGAPQSRPATGPVAEDVRAALEGGTEGFDHEAWGELLVEGTRDGLVDYLYFQRHRERLDAYLDRLAAAELAALRPAELEALLVNAYNALTVRTILEHPGVASIRDIDGVWTEIRHLVGGHELTLDEIEHNLLRPYFRDPRLHFVLNCASRSCAPLPPHAFEGERLEAQLEERTRAFLRDTANVRVRDGTLLLSRYFDWYGDDFTGADWEPRAPTAAAFVARYARPDVAAFIRDRDGDPPIAFLEYDWSLNAAVPPDPAMGAGDGAVATDGTERGWVDRLRARVQGLGPAAPVAYAAVYAVAVVLLVPGAPLTIGAGLAFGLLWGTVVTAAAAVTGAALAFLLGRHLLRDRVRGWLRGREKLEAVDRAVEREGWKVVALTRLSPVFPFNLQNYFYGLTGVGFWPYVGASAVGMLPGTLLYVYIGAAGARVVSAATGTADWGRTALQVVGLLATVAVVVLVARVARRELERATAAPAAAADIGAAEDTTDAGDAGKAGEPPEPARGVS